MMERVYLLMIKKGVVPVPSLLLHHYRELGLSDQEMMLIIHIMNFQQEGKAFVAIQQLSERMSAEELQIVTSLQKLIHKGFVEIGENTGEEEIRVDPMYAKLAQLLSNKQEFFPAPSVSKPEENKNLYSVFEQEFGRPLSPIECETLGIWQDHDKYSAELIVAALREAVISGKLSFRYIDRILYEWQKNQIRTPQQARDFSLKFRKPPQSSPKKAESFPLFNWLENDST
jgi:DNA replication protein